MGSTQYKNTKIKRSKTAMARTFLSRPMQQALDDGLLTDRTVFDYGCGRGDDMRNLNAVGIECTGWDPAHNPDTAISPANVVNLGFVVNVIEDQTERRQALLNAWELAHDLLVVSGRLTWENDLTDSNRFADGVITAGDTFQKFYTHEELKAWVETHLDGHVRTAAPGILYVFRKRSAEQRLLARQTRSGHNRRRAIAEILSDRHAATLNPLHEFVTEHRRLPNPTEVTTSAELVDTFGSIKDAFYILRAASPTTDWPDIGGSTQTKSRRRFEQNLDILQPLVDFLTERGRLPKDSELAASPEISDEFGSIRQAFTLIRRVTGPEVWEEHAAKAREDFLVYCALSAFGGRPKLSDMPDDLQADAKDLFGSYKAARSEADDLLYSIADMNKIESACHDAPIGKLTPEALYIHVDYLHTLPPILRVYDGAARQLTGNVDDATLVKLNRLKPQVSYLVYPTFDTEAHPALKYSIVGKLSEGRMKHRSFAGSTSPPILHRKETFIGPADHRSSKFSRLTRREEALGLLDRSDIGTRHAWISVLAEQDLRIEGHRIVTTSREASIPRK